MKLLRIPALALVLCFLLSTAALAQPEDKWFDTGKEAMALLSYKEYDQAMALLQMTDIAREDLAAAIEQDFRALFRGTVQTDVAVMFADADDKWFLAIPVIEPADDQVETMVFALSRQGCTEILFATWGEVMEAVDQSAAPIWNVEYMPGAPILETDT